jgi:hypothetical protein
MKEIKSFQDLVNLFDELYSTCTKEEVKEEIKKDCSSKECGHKEYKEECKHDTSALNVELSKDVFMVDKDSYLLRNKVNGTSIAENTEVIFDHSSEDIVVPGITESQLLYVLLYRNKDNKKRYELVKQLLNTY